MPTVGMIVPPAEGNVPPEPPALYPEIAFLAEGLALPELTLDGYESVIAHTANLASRLKERGAEAISLMGTSLSFYRGHEGNRQVLKAMREATGLPVTTMTDSVLSALDSFDAKRISVATAYTKPVNRTLQVYLEAAGYEVVSMVSLGLKGVSDILSVGDQELMDLGLKAHNEGPESDALFMSCGGLRTLPVVAPLEAAVNKPVITSATAGAWGAVRLVGHPGTSAGWGSLFDTDAPLLAS